MSSIKVLLADDEVLDRQLIRLMLEESNLPVTIVGEASSGFEVVELASRLEPELIILDIKMPGSSGLDAARQIRVRLPECKFVMVSAYDIFEFAQDAVKLGVNNYLLKPVEQQEFMGLVRKLVNLIEDERRIQQEDEHMRAQIIEAHPLLLAEFIGDLLSGRISDRVEASRRAQFLGIPERPLSAMVVSIDGFAGLTKTWTETERQLLKQKVRDAISVGISKVESICCASVLSSVRGGNRVVLLVPADDLKDPYEERVEMVKMGTIICDTVAQMTPVTVSIGISRSRKDLLELVKSYDEAVRAQRYKFLIGHNAVMHIEDVEAGGGQQGYYPLELERVLIARVQEADRQGVKVVIERLFDDLSQRSHLDPDTVKSHLFGLLLFMSCQVSGEGGTSGDYDGATTQPEFGSDDLDNVETCTELKEWFSNAIDKILTRLEAFRLSRKAELLAAAVQHIDKNYFMNLSLESVARVLYVSPYYLSRIFKEEKAITFLDYLTSVRIREAQGLLKNSNLTVSVIASKVGYLTPNHFSRVFKKIVGVTPCDYRTRESNVGDFSNESRSI